MRGCVYERDFEAFEHSPCDPTHVVRSIVDFGKFMGLEVVYEDMEELVDQYDEEFIPQKLQNLYLEVQQTADEEFSSDEKEEMGENVPSSEIKDISIWSKIKRFVEKYHPDKVVVSRVCKLFNDNFSFHFSKY